MYSNSLIALCSIIYTDSDVFTDTITESYDQYSDTLSLEQELVEAQDSKTVWMIIAIVSLALAFSSFAFIIVLACLLCKNLKSNNKSIVEIREAGGKNGKPFEQGIFNIANYLATQACACDMCFENFTCGIRKFHTKA